MFYAFFEDVKSSLFLLSHELSNFCPNYTDKITKVLAGDKTQKIKSMTFFDDVQSSLLFDAYDFLALVTRLD